VPQLKAHGTSGTDVFLTNVESAQGEQVLDEHFPGGTGAPTMIVASADTVQDVADAADVDGVDSVTVIPGRDGRPATAAGRARSAVVLDAPAASQDALNTVQRIRNAVHQVPGGQAVVGGQDALQLDTNLTSERDRTVIIPIVLVVVFLVLALLL